MNLKRAILSIFVIGVVAVVGLTATQAFFNDTETSTGNILQAGALDLKIDNTCYYNGQACINGNWGGGDEEGQECSCTWASKDLGEGDVFFSLLDLKPGDWEEDTISVNVDNDAWLCADINITRHADNTCTGPEQIDENEACSDPDGPGDLAQELRFTFWRDDGDNVFEADEVNSVLTEGTADAVLGDASWALADSSTIGGPIPGRETFYIGKFFCFGTATQAPVVQDGSGSTGTNGPDSERGTGFICDGSLVDNKAQTDSLEGDITFYAEQARHNDDFLCEPEETIACVPGFATDVVSSAQGTRKDGSGILADRTDPNDALGAPQSAGLASDTPVVAGSFFALGFGPNNTPGGNIVLSFDNPIVDQAGFDFRVFEVTGGTYPDEKIMVEASQDGSTWHLVSASATRDAFFDLDDTPLPWASHLRITDVSDKSIFPTDADAYDLDGVQTFCGTEPES